MARSLEIKLGLLGFSSFFASVAASACGCGKQIERSTIDTNTYRLGLSSRLSGTFRGRLGGGFGCGSGLLNVDNYSRLVVFGHMMRTANLSFDFFLGCLLKWGG